jgi:hypothetical protein
MLDKCGITKDKASFAVGLPEDNNYGETIVPIIYKDPLL